MAKRRKLKRIYRRLTDEERERHARIREAAYRDIPPKHKKGRKRR